MSIIPIDSKLYKNLRQLSQEKRMICIAGLPGAGKSLLVQQLSLIANEVGRQVHLIQYDVSRKAFETEDVLQRFPEKEGVTDPTIRKATGLWARQAVADWYSQNYSAEHLLIAEMPLIGNRFIEFARVQEDDAEKHLVADACTFIIPVPSWEVREVIEETRAQTIASPQHEDEKLDAPPQVLQALWQEVNAVARDIGLTKANPNTPYNPYIYGGVYEALLKDRPFQTLLIEDVLTPETSVYDIGISVNHILPSAIQTNDYLEQVNTSMTRQELLADVQAWHSYITDNPKLQDAGVALKLPSPESLLGLVPDLTPQELEALQAIYNLAIVATVEEELQVIDATLEVFRNAFVSEKADSAAQEKFDIYDSYFNVSRTAEKPAQSFVIGLLEAYRNVIENLNQDPHELTVVELPLLRLGLETSLRSVTNV